MTTFLRAVPEHLVAMVADGQASVLGSTVRALDGKILGHLQETSALTQALLSGVPFDPVGAALKVATIVQNEQIKSGLKLLAHLQQASIALNVIGIGVSIAGFAVIAHKIDRLDAKIDALAGRIDHIAADIKVLRHEPVKRDLNRLLALASLLEEGWGIADPTTQWQRVAYEAVELQLGFQERAIALIEGRDTPAIREAAPFVEASALAFRLRVNARLAMGDTGAAEAILLDEATHLQRLGPRYQLSTLAMHQLKGEAVPAGTDQWSARLAVIAHTLSEDVELMRRREVATASAIETLVDLRAHRIDSRGWLEAARNETASPFLFLPAAVER